MTDPFAPPSDPFAKSAPQSARQSAPTSAPGIANPYAVQAFPEPEWVTATQPRPATAPRLRVLAAAVASGLVAAMLLGDGVGVNLLLCAGAATVGAALVARATGRRIRPWTVVWALTALALLAVPALVSAGWPVVLAVVAALGIGSLALHGGRRWAGVLLGPVGIWSHLLPSLPWATAALRAHSYPGRETVVRVVKAVLVSVGLLIVFGLLLGTADSQVGSLLGALVPSIDAPGLPLQIVFFALGLLGALGAAHAAAAPRRWDRLPVRQGPERGRLEWALPLVVLNLLFAVFVAVQLTVLLSGAGSITRRTGLTPAEYARQGFWQLLWVIVLTLVVVALAKYWAPRSNDGDRLLVKSLLGLLCSLTLVVVLSALYRMKLYVDAFGLSRLRISVAGVELWLGVVFVLVIVGSVLGARSWLPRAVVLSAALGVAAYGLIGPDALIAEQNVARYEQTGKIDVGYLHGLSADAVPALDRLPGDRRTCALWQINQDLGTDTPPWYATSLAEARAREILRARPVPNDDSACARIGVDLEAESSG